MIQIQIKIYVLHKYNFIIFSKKNIILIMRFNKNLYIFLIALRKYVAM